MSSVLKVLFVCVENSCRSQMAEGFAKFYGKGLIKAYSAGSRPSGYVNPSAIKAMKEVNIDISEQHSKGFNELGEKDFDLVITLGCGDVCPFVPAERHIHWEIEDPKGKDMMAFRKARWDIWRHVTQLIDSLKKPSGRKGT